MKPQRKDSYQIMMYVLMGTTLVTAAGFGIWQALRGDSSMAMRAIFTPLFLLMPTIFRLIGLNHSYKLYCMGYAFIAFAYSYGCIYGAFKGSGFMDKFSHFLSGFLFTIIGFCLYFWLGGFAEDALRQKTALAVTYALFFSMAVAVTWEIFEFMDFNLTGNDSQNHLTTGVFDTMQDIIACLISSLLSAGSFLLYRYKGVKLLTGAVVEDFYHVNRQPRPPRRKAKAKGAGPKQ